MSTIIVTRDAPIATVQLDRPEVLNALSEELMADLVAALEELDRDPEIRCIVLTGNDKAFAAGADIKDSFVTATAVSMLEQDLTSAWVAFARCGHRSSPPSRDTPSVVGASSRCCATSSSPPRPRSSVSPR